MTETRDPLMVGKASDGRLVRRPLSPHLQVYGWPLSMALSILHRATGCAVSVGTLLLTWWLVAAASSDSAYATVSAFLRSWIGLLLLFGWTVALFFHLLNGIRHLVWDVGYGFEKREVNRTGVAVVAGTAALTALVWAIGCTAL